MYFGNKVEAPGDRKSLLQWARQVQGNVWSRPYEGASQTGRRKRDSWLKILMMVPTHRFGDNDRCGTTGRLVMKLCQKLTSFKCY